MTSKITFTIGGEKHVLPIDSSKTLRVGSVSPSVAMEVEEVGMTDEAKALVERLRDFVIAEDIDLAADLIETQARKIERLRATGEQMLIAFAEGTNWTPEKRAAYQAMSAALAGDSHDQ